MGLAARCLTICIGILFLTTACENRATAVDVRFDEGFSPSEYEERIIHLEEMKRQFIVDPGDLFLVDANTVRLNSQKLRRAIIRGSQVASADSSKEFRFYVFISGFEESSDWLNPIAINVLVDSDGRVVNVRCHPQIRAQCEGYGEATSSTLLFWYFGVR